MNITQQHAFRELDADMQFAVFAMLRCAARDPDNHELHVTRSGAKAKPTTLQVTLAPEHEPCPPVNTVPYVGTWLGDQGLVSILKSGLGQGWRGPFRFRPEILSWYRKTHQATDHDIRAALARHYHDLAIDAEYTDDALVVFDSDAVATAIDYPQVRVETNVRAMLRMGFLRDAGRGRPGMPRYLDLTQPGHRWVLDGCPRNMSQSMTVEVALSVDDELQQAMKAIAALTLSDVERDRYELALRRFTDDVKKGKTTWETVRDLFAMASDGKNVAAPIFSMMAQHADIIEQVFAGLS